MLALFVSKGEREKQKRKYTSLFTNHLQTAFLKDTQLPGDVMSWESEAITKSMVSKRSHCKEKPWQNAKWYQFFLSLNLPYSYLVRIHMI